MARFHPLEVTDIRRDTRDAVVVTLKPRPEDAEGFAFTQGQYLTFRRAFDGAELRRSYSICAGLDEGCLRVGVKRVEGGAFSTFVNEELAVGDTLEAMAPSGRFFTVLEPDRARHYLGFAGGSGITPVLSILKTVLAREPASTFTLVYANRQTSSIMFRETLEDLKNLYLGRLSVIHVLETEGQEIDLFTGRVDAAKLEMLFRLWVDPGTVDTAFICGPEPMMLTIAESLRRHGLSDDQIKYELFGSSQQGRAKAPAVSKVAREAQGTCEVSVTLDGTTRNFTMPKDGEAILDAAIRNSMDAPYSCKAGVCSTCRAKVIEGEVEMIQNHALEDYEVRAGYVLSCQCLPVSDKVVLSYDE
ncbi:phenylacetate-CoA oxygenase/reductase subunit PaaK [Pseudooceanicola sp. CBS1P-1]|uniref:Phenylacetate-CoA oxygenase/reductase subunit PaaK n=1 Tax=Pseudooceanicola albus TaxID=2692189 RepID=A0A6L7G411_9RHOB|nr:MULTISPECIES: 1,2-phenylacetyl-CoA epoxidase subunit PaaE [Pseudooceanicola]MBT9385400.1 phenylacetate-CoA oxygenase/reductase subunit PaaK [Pseudooceanicola endophyticus]MXN18741.1 phenylacetate-CoA oxygenase/reductase subunit PaaK [Pseudooceanicola albus]